MPSFNFLFSFFPFYLISFSVSYSFSILYLFIYFNLLELFNQTSQWKSSRFVDGIL